VDSMSLAGVIDDQKAHGKVSLFHRCSGVERVTRPELA
jgi:hypothetical protein